MTRTGWVGGMAAALALAAAGCGDDNGGTSAAPGACTPPATATAFFKPDVYGTLTTRCTPCHADAQTARPKFASLDPEVAYSAARAAVTVSSPAQSPLVALGNGGSGHPDQLDDAQAATVTRWIQECAQNNTRDATATTTR